MATDKTLLANIPPVNQVLAESPLAELAADNLRELVVFCIQRELDLFRTQRLTQGHQGHEKVPTREAILAQVAAAAQQRLGTLLQPSLRRVVNATGVILHTGLGRAPLALEARENLSRIAEGYCNLEIDLETGKRGSRTSHVEEILCFLTGAEAACVVNNNAAAVLIALNTFAFNKDAVVSRGQLVEIGGSFRMPQVMEKSGSRMIEVGTTNKTHLADYDRAIDEKTGVVCVVHTSNYRVQGFTEEAPLAEVVKLAHAKEVPVLHDLGGGILCDLRAYDLPHEPVVGDSVADGVDLITFSGDKVLGGPQSGIIVGKKRYIDQVKENPLMRALRCDKLTYAILESSLKQFLRPAEVRSTSQVFALLLEPLKAIKVRAQRLADAINALVDCTLVAEVTESHAQIGSGALPLEKIPSKAVSLRSTEITTETLARQMRLHDPPVLGYIRENRLFLDLRTVLPGEEESILAGVQCNFKNQAL